MKSQDYIAKIGRNALIRAIMVDVPVAAIVAPLDDPNVPMAGVVALTLLGSSANYMIRDVARDYGHPYIGAIIGGSFYHSVIDSLSYKSILEGSMRQLGFEFNLNNNPYINEPGGTLFPAIAIEAGQSLLEGHGLLRGGLIGSYVGVAIEKFYNPLVAYLNSAPNNNARER